MAEQLEKDDSEDFKIIERPIDFFYDDVKYYTIMLSFTNLPNVNDDNAAAWDIFLADAWNQHFPQTDIIKDFFIYCIYHTGLVGRFYRIKSCLWLDDVRCFLTDRLPNPDLSMEICRELHRLARFLLMTASSDSSLDSNLILDVHIGDGECNIDEQNLNVLNIEELPNENERVLVFHVHINYSSYEEMLTCSGSQTNRSSNFDANGKTSHDESTVSNAPKSSLIPEQSHPISKSETDSKDVDNWYKYGARPKNNQYSRKHRPKNSEMQKGYENADIRRKPVETSTSTRFSRDENLTGKSMKHINEKTEGNSLYSKNIHEEFQDLSLSSCSNASKSQRNFDEARNPLKEKKLTLQEFQDPSFSSCSEMIEQGSSPANEKYSRHSNSESSVLKYLLSKSEKFASPSIPLASEDNRYYEKYGAKPKNKQFGQKSDRETLEVKEECKTNDFVVKGDESQSFGRKEFEFLQKFPQYRRVFCSNEELEEMSYDMRNIQILYQNTIMDMNNFDFSSSVPSDDDNIELDSPVKDNQFTCKAQRAAFLKMPFINFPPLFTEHDNLNTVTFTTNIGLQVREAMLRHEMKMFFENYKFPDSALKDTKFTDAATVSNKVHIIDGEPLPVGATCASYDSFRHNLIHDVPHFPSSAHESPPPYSEILQSAPNKHYSTPEKASIHSDVPDLVPLENTNDETKLNNSYEDELIWLSDHLSEESLDYDTSSDNDATSNV